MGREGITPADVVRACVSLRKQRRRMGLRNVRLELGRGSYRTIGKHLRLLALRELDRSRQRT
ncbi:DNA-binding protein [Paraburkholderia agricolaris]|uniref:DNA-binding protein n=1 Tax=Paraburkholderia agricolaris TaxID=2152888 RepID=UPI003CCD0357